MRIIVFGLGEYNEKVYISAWSILFVSGCGSQNLAPLEDKTTKLRDNNHQLKLDIQQLNEDISNQKSKLLDYNKIKKIVKNVL